MNKSFKGIILDYYLHKELRFLYFFQFSVKIPIFRLFRF